MPKILKYLLIIKAQITALLLLFALFSLSEAALAAPVIDPQTSFTNAAGQKILFSEVLSRKKRILLSFIDFNCRSHCKQTLQLLSRELKFLGDKPGKDFILVTVGRGSPEEGRKASLKALWRVVPVLEKIEEDWLFLTADKDTFETVAQTFGAPLVEGSHAPIIALLEEGGEASSYIIGGLGAPGDLKRFIDRSLTGEPSRVNMGRVCKATHESPETLRAISWMRWGLFLVMLLMGSLLLYLVRKR